MSHKGETEFQSPQILNIKQELVPETLNRPYKNRVADELQHQLDNQSASFSVSACTDHFTQNKS